MTVGDLKDETSRVAASLNICPEDYRFLSWANEAEERMANAGRWWGSVQEVQFCVDTEGCFSLPREVAYLERVAINGSNVAVVNGWYQFTRQVANVAQCSSCASGCSSSSGRCSCCGGLMMQNRNGMSATFSTTIGANKKIRLYPTDVLDVGKKVVLQGNDSNNIWVRLPDSTGALVDGEELVLAFPFVDSVTVWASGSPLGVKKEVTRKRVLGYEYDTVSGGEVQIADWQPGETRPAYRVGYIPGLASTGCTSCTDGGANGRRTLTGMASLQHVPLVSDGDWLLFQNMAAYKAAMIAVKAWEEGDVGKGDYYFYGRQSSPSNARGPMRVVNRGGAIPLLKAELVKNTGGIVNASIIIDQTDKLARQMVGFW